VRAACEVLLELSGSAMILAELERLEPGLIPVLRRRAAAWCLANGRPEEALEYSMAAGDIDVVAGLVEGSLGLACDRWRHRSTGGRWQVPAGYPAGRARSRGLLADRCLDGPARNVARQLPAVSSPASLLAGTGAASGQWQDRFTDHPALPVPGSPGIFGRLSQGRQRACVRQEDLVAAAVAATTPGTKSSPIDRTPARAASARQTAPMIKGGLGRRPAAARASDPAPAASSATYHHAGELPCPPTMTM
jgi:hypothetical protein